MKTTISQVGMVAGPDLWADGPGDGQRSTVSRSDFGGLGVWNGDTFWPSSTRQVSRTAGPDFIGVYVEANNDAFWVSSRLRFTESRSSGSNPSPT